MFAFRNTLIFKNDVSSSRLYNSIEIQNFIKILGLKRSMKYDTETSLNELRYGSIILMANQDQDGSIFKGSIINFIYSLWPDLIRKPGFISEFITPLVKVNMKENSEIKYIFTRFQNLMSGRRIIMKMIIYSSFIMALQLQMMKK